MKKNIGTVEIVIRLLAAVVFGNLAISQASLGGSNMPFFILAFYLALTAIWGWCPLYALFHVHTNHQSHHHQ